MPLDVMCPHCHRLFSIRKQEKELVRETVVHEDHPEEKSQALVGSYRGGATHGYMAPPPSAPPPAYEDIMTYKLYLKCKHCGYEWTETKEETVKF